MGDELFLFRHQLHNVFTRIRHFAECGIEGNYLACQSRNFVDIGCTGDPQQSSENMSSAKWILWCTAAYNMRILPSRVCVPRWLSAFELLVVMLGVTSSTPS